MANNNNNNNAKSEKVDLTKFPRTRHLFDAGGGVGRDDLLMTKKEMEAFLKNDVALEEKIDGANLGITMDKDYNMTFQNRSHFVVSSSAAQWKGLDQWVSEHPGLYEFLTPDYILFGEWVYAKHSIHYTALPGYFIAFDIYDKNQKQYLSRFERDAMLKDTGIPVVPLIASGKDMTQDAIKKYLNQQSKFYNGPVEGVYLRIDGPKYLQERAKVVRADFLETNSNSEVEHWSKKQLVKNIIKFD